MKTAIHPKWNHGANVICACGNTFVTGSMQDEIRVDICYACHPFYTGSLRFLDVQGRVDRFTKLRDAAKNHKNAGSKKSGKQEAKVAPKSLKEMLEDQKSKIADAATV